MNPEQNINRQNKTTPKLERKDSFYNANKLVPPSPKDSQTPKNPGSSNSSGSVSQNQTNNK